MAIFCTCIDRFLLNSGADSQSHLAQLRAEVAARGVVFAHEGGLLVGGERRKQPQHREHSDGNVGGGRRRHLIVRFVEWLLEVRDRRRGRHRRRRERRRRERERRSWQRACRERYMSSLVQSYSMHTICRPKLTLKSFLALSIEFQHKFFVITL